MGLIKSLVSAGSTAIGDQFLEFVDCPQVDDDVVIQRGRVHHGPGNTKFGENIITNGSKIAVPVGMAMMIIDNGEIKEFSAIPGEFTWEQSTEPSIFTGGLGKGIVETFKTIGKRFTFGGQEAKDQRVYYVNIKKIPNTFGSRQPETIQDPVYESVEITYNGEFTMTIDDPIIFVNTIIGSNPKDTIKIDEVLKGSGSQSIFKSTFANKISGAISTVMVQNNVSFRQIQSYKEDITKQMNILLDEEWHQKYGIVVDDVTLFINATDASREIIRETDSEIQKTRRLGKEYSNNMAGTMAAATGQAMVNASKNENGAMMGFYGMGMAQQTGANVLGTVSGMPQQGSVEQNATQPPMPGTIFATQPTQPVEAPVEDVAVAAAATEVAKKFCSNCGEEVKSKFCTNCGTKYEEATVEAKTCPNCGIKVDATEKYCSECGTAVE